MRFNKVETIPERCQKHKLQDFIADFMTSGIDVAEVIFDANDYKSASVARSCIGVAIARMNAPVKVSRRGDRVFIYKV